MAVAVEMTDLEYARLQFEQMLEFNNFSREKNEDGSYYHTRINNLWVFYQHAFREGRKSAGGSCEC